jgi:hypothetical protein
MESNTSLTSLDVHVICTHHIVLPLLSAAAAVDSPNLRRLSRTRIVIKDDQRCSGIATKV